MEDQTRLLIKEVFGESSDSGEDEDDEQEQEEERRCLQETNPNNNWERIRGIKGLWLCTDFLSPQHQSSLLSSIDNEGWFTEASHNQAMRFGDIPMWALELSSSIRKVVLFSDHVGETMPSDLLWREPLFDQLIVNVYQPGEGICSHIDLMRFEDGIAIVSLESSCVMHFTSVEEEVGDIGMEGKMNPPAAKIPVYLTPGSLVLMSGEARYLWKHEINRKPGFQMWEEREINQKRRTSITLRKLCKVE